MGVKNRRYGHIPGYQVSKDEWQEALAKQGSEGGMGAVFMRKEDHVTAYIYIYIYNATMHTVVMP